MCRSYDLAARAIRKRQAARRERDASTCQHILVDENDGIEENAVEQLMQGKEFAIDSRAKMTSYILSSTPMGALKIRLGTVSKGSRDLHESEPP